MKKIVLVFGLIAGLIVTASMAVSISLCYNDPAMLAGGTAMVIGYLSMIIAFSMIYVGVKNYRDKFGNGYITFGKAFKVGFLISLVASILYVIIWAVMYKFMFPDFLEVYSKATLDNMAGASAAEVEEKTKQMNQMNELYKNPVFFVLITISEILPVGLIIAVIAALILKRGRKEPALAV